MTIKRISPSLIKTNNAVDGDFLVFDAANNAVEFRTSVSVDSNAWTNANDYNTYTTVTGLIDTVNANLDALPDSAANDYSTYTTLSGLIDTVQDNVAALDNNAWVNANDYATYTALSSLIDTVQDNVDSQTSNTQIYVSDTLLSNTALIFEAGSGISLSANATTHVTTITTSMSNVTSQEIAIDGSSNSFTLVKSAANTNMLLVSYEGILQKPREYSVEGTTLTIANTRPLVAGANLEVRYFDFFDLSGVSEGGGGGGYVFQGSVSGYTSGGAIGPVNTIDKFPFSTDSNATDVGNLTQARQRQAGQSSTESGYNAGGSTGANVNTIDKFSFSADGNATDVGDLTQSRGGVGGQSSSVSGYTSGGRIPPVAVVNTVDKFPFSADANATDVGDLTVGRDFVAGQSSLENGYSSGGDPSTNVIDKFPFASDSNATDVGDITVIKKGASGKSSTTSGYTSGGDIPGLG